MVRRRMRESLLLAITRPETWAWLVHHSEIRIKSTVQTSYHAYAPLMGSATLTLLAIAQLPLPPAAISVFFPFLDHPSDLQGDHSAWYKPPVNMLGCSAMLPGQ